MREYFMTNTQTFKPELTGEELSMVWVIRRNPGILESLDILKKKHEDAKWSNPENDGPLDVGTFSEWLKNL